MRYCGSKRRFMKELLPILMKDADKETFFWDLFMGGANVLSEIPLKNKYGVDNNKFIVALWREVQKNGFANIPTNVTEERYNDVKKSYLTGENFFPDYLIGYVGVCCSFGSSWFNGYARFNPKKNEDHIAEALRGFKKQVVDFKNFDDTEFYYSSYNDFKYFNPNTILYCDIPYFSTKKYENDFDHEAFWNWARKIAPKVKHLYISEYDAPDDFECIWQAEKKDGLGRKEGKPQNIKIEKLFELRK